MAPTSALLQRPATQTKGSDFTPLLREIKTSGLLERRSSATTPATSRSDALAVSMTSSAGCTPTSCSG
jgi:hypothetical protein